MPIYEYKCKQCGLVSEVLIKGSQDKPVCKCGSDDMEKLISSFAVSEGHAGSQTGCSDGSCAINRSPCTSGMCGL